MIPAGSAARSQVHYGLSSVFFPTSHAYVPHCRAPRAGGKIPLEALPPPWSRTPARGMATRGRIDTKLLFVENGEFAAALEVQIQFDEGQEE
jgi:hypothetical protein